MLCKVCQSHLDPKAIFRRQTAWEIEGLEARVKSYTPMEKMRDIVVILKENMGMLKEINK